MPAGLFRSFSTSAKLPTTTIQQKRHTASDSDADYISNEEIRGEDFSRCMSEQAAEFAEEEQTRWAGESLRSDEFEKLVSGIAADAEIEEKRHEKATDTMLREQQTAFTELETVRNGIFTRGRTQRAKAFAKSQHKHEKDSKCHDALRAERRREGRKLRKETCEELRTTLQAQLESLLAEQEDAFLRNEERRRGIVQQLAVNTGSKPAMTNGVHQDSEGPREVPFPEPMFNDWRSPSRSSRRRSRSPRPPMPPIVIQQAPPPIMPGVIPGFMPSYNKQTSLPGSPQGDGFEPLQPLERRSAFAVAQESRDRLFQDAERQREEEFTSAEARRDEAENERRRRFRTFADSLKSRAEINIDQANDAFSRAEKIRKLAEAARGREYYNDMSIIATAYEEFTKGLRGKAEGDDSAEKQIDESMMYAFWFLFDRHAKVIQEALRGMNKRFSDAQAHRGTALGLPPVFLYLEASPPSPSMSPAHPPFLPNGGPVFPPGFIPAMPTMMPPLIMARSSSPDSSSSSRRRRRRSPSPPTGFAAQALFMNHDIPSLPLPDDHSTIGSNLEVPPSNTEQRQQSVYKKSKARRASAFAANAARRENIFVIAEIKRKHEFRLGQQERRAAWEELKRGCAKKFKGTLLALGREYAKSEEARAKEFIQQEEARARWFKDGQLKREEDYHKTQKELTEECFRNEDQRQRRLWEWAEKVQIGEKAGQQALFDEEERRREDAFLEMIQQVKGHHDS